MKRMTLPVCLGVVALGLCSCATQDMIAKAQGRPGPLDPPNAAPGRPQPAYYALVPLVLPFDLVAWPVEYFYMKDREQASAPPPGYPQQPPAGYYQQQGPPMEPYRPNRPASGGTSW